MAWWPHAIKIARQRLYRLGLQRGLSITPGGETLAERADLGGDRRPLAGSAFAVLQGRFMPRTDQSCAFEATHQTAPGAQHRRQRLALCAPQPQQRSEEHTSELQSLMRISYAVFCLKK